MMGTSSVKIMIIISSPILITNNSFIIPGYGSRVSICRQRDECMCKCMCECVCYEREANDDRNSFVLTLTTASLRSTQIHLALLNQPDPSQEAHSQGKFTVQICWKVFAIEGHQPSSTLVLNTVKSSCSTL